MFIVNNYVFYNNFFKVFIVNCDIDDLFSKNVSVISRGLSHFGSLFSSSKHTHQNPAQQQQQKPAPV
jgi:hypothetical protein